jgi:hypothetical protein
MRYEYETLPQDYASIPFGIMIRLRLGAPELALHLPFRSW